MASALNIINSENTGDLCGSAYVDIAFRSWLADKLQTDERYARALCEQEDTRALHEQERFQKVLDMSTHEFEKVEKRRFKWDSEASDEVVYLMVPDVPGLDGAYTGTVFEKRSSFILIVTDQRINITS